MAIDYAVFEQAKDYALHITDNNSERVASASKYRQMYELDSPIQSNIEGVGAHVKFVADPSPRVRTQGAKRLLTATEMSFSIPHEDNAAEADMIDNLEEAAKTIWWRSGLANGAPLEEDMVLSALLFDEVHVQVNKTADMLKHFEEGVEAQKKINKDYEPAPAIKERIERLSKSTPYLCEVVNVEAGYPEWDALGLRRYFSKRTVTRGYLLDMYGLACDDPHEEVVLCDLWDLEWRHIWIEEQEDEPIVQEKHGLPFIPIVCYLVEGSRNIWRDPDKQRQPFLYTMQKAGLWDLNTIWLSSMATNVKTFGLIANFIYQGDGSPRYESTGVMAVHSVGPDESLAPMEMPINGKAVQDMYGLTDELTTQATIYPQSLGAPGGSGDPYSKTALLHQAGRLPLVTIQRQVANCAAEAMWLALRWMRHEPEQYAARGKTQAVEIDAGQIPEFLVVEAALEIDLPQDQLQMMNVAGQSRQLMGDAWTIENVVNEAQPKQVIMQRTAEEVFQFNKQMYFQRMQQQAQMEIQQAQMQQQMMAQQAQMEMQGGPPMSPEEEAALAQAEGGAPMMPEPDRPPVPGVMG